MVALRRLLWSWPASRAARRTPHAFSGEASRHRVDRFIAGTRIAFIFCAFLAIIVHPSGSARNAPSKSDPVSLDTVSTTMTAAKEAGHARQATEVHDSWQ
jgi:hypothetical protein